MYSRVHGSSHITYILLGSAAQLPWAENWRSRRPEAPSLSLPLCFDPFLPKATVCAVAIIVMAVVVFAINLILKRNLG